MSRHLTSGLLALSVVAFLALPPAGRAEAAAAPSQPISWQSAGDSYSSGEGVFGNRGACAQSARAYGPLTASTLKSKDWKFSSTTLTACTGAVVEDLFNSRSAGGGINGSLWDWSNRKPGGQGGPERVDIMTMSFGGNDIGFADIISDCLVGLPDNWLSLAGGIGGGAASSVSGCDPSYEELEARVDALLDPTQKQGCGSRRESNNYACTLDIGERQGSIVDFYYDIVSQRLTPNGRLYVVGYPRLFAPVSQWPRWARVGCQGVLRGDTEKLGRLAEHLNVKIDEAVDRANQKLGNRVVYMDRLAQHATGGHELCGTGSDYLNGVAFDRGDGPGARKETSFHPNAASHAAASRALVTLVEKTFPRTKPGSTAQPLTIV